MLQLLILMIERLGLIVTIAFILTRATAFRNLIDHKLDKKAMLKLSVLFGVFGIIGTYTGISIKPSHANTALWMSHAVKVDLDEALANSRVVGVAIGGLLGGPLVGLGAGLIAGVHRMLLGGFTGLACGISTLTEGIFAGFVYKKIGDKRIVSVGTALITGVIAETLQMFIILLIAKPFAQAWSLVKIISLPMIIANSIGIAIFIAIIRIVVYDEDRLEARQAQKVLHIADKMLMHLRSGLNEESATEISRLLLKTTGVSAVSITDREKILSHVGIGDDHHKPGKKVLTDATKKVLQTGVLYEPQSLTEIHCAYPKCPLVTAIIVPLKKSNVVIGVLKFYFSNRKQVKPVDRELAEGLGKLLSHQLEVVEAEKQSKLIKEAEIKALQAQVNPHFLFNSLNTIVALIRKEPDMARRLLIQLGYFFRQNLNASLREMVSLHEEIEHTKAYLEIERVRFSDRLDVKINVEQELDNVSLPPLILQPLVENAVKHGLKDQQQQGQLVIKVTKDGEFARISVSDNGVGIPTNKIDELLHSRVESANGTGLGLYNVQQRLLGYFGQEAQLHIESSVSEGTVIWFKIPIKAGGQNYD